MVGGSEEMLPQENVHIHYPQRLVLCFLSLKFQSPAPLIPTPMLLNLPYKAKVLHNFVIILGFLIQSYFYFHVLLSSSVAENYSQRGKKITCYNVSIACQVLELLTN